MSKSVYSKDYKEIIERLKIARIEAGLAQQDVAEIKKFATIYKKDVSFFIK